MKRKLLGYYDYTVVLTYLGMLSATAGILCMICNQYLAGMILLMIAGICDMFDGTVASTKARTLPEKHFGIQIDSLSDLISFGVLPGIFIFQFLDHRPAAGVLAAVYVLCALIRLAYFNVLEAERQAQTTGRRTSYLGVPVTTIALLLPAVFLLLSWGVLKTRAALPIMMALTAAGFLAPVEIKKPAHLGKMLLILLGVLELAGLLLLIRRIPL